MIIGVPKEVKNNEYRVAITPGGVKQRVKNSRRVVIEKEAGVGAGLFDEDYLAEGAVILDTAAEVWGQTALPLKVKEPLESEWPHIREGQILFTYFHFASNQALTDATMPYALQIARYGWPDAARQVSAIRRGVNIVNGTIVFIRAAGAFGLPGRPLEEVL